MATLGEGSDEKAFERSARNLLPALLKVLRGNNTSLKTYATASLVNMSCGKENMKTQLVGDGILKLCIKQLKEKDDDLSVYTLTLLVNLTKQPHHRYLFAQEGGIPMLVDILTSSYQNLLKSRILAEVASVIGQLCGDPEIRKIIEQFPVVPCFLWVYDSAQPNTKLKSKVLFVLRQLSISGAVKVKVGKHVIPTLLDNLGLATPRFPECALNIILLLISLASINTNALMMVEQIDVNLETCGIQENGQEAKNHRLARLLWPKVEILKARIQEARL
eukprot:TRINITY_DN2540_c3_g1_i1.p1 TRINITY_DN2540_c3_g1~~TRINITY_DN2540_c3_g1_i1.p1  ORF type:complete len:316 (-),score=53.35 TRINITY_DN2540_c3_g1_i1:127-954(-)